MDHGFEQIYAEDYTAEEISGAFDKIRSDKNYGTENLKTEISIIG